MKKIGTLTSGGDCQSLNAAMRGVAKALYEKETEIEIYGILDGADDEDSGEKSTASSGDLDALFDDVVEFVLSTGNTSTSYVQRKFSVGFNRAARIMDQLEEQGILGPMKNGKREILARRSEY